MTQQEKEKLELRALKLLFDYYRYFLKCDEAKQFGYVSSKSYWRFDRVTAQYVWESKPPTIWLRKYKSKEKRKEVEKMYQLLKLSPDVAVKEDTSRTYGYHLEVVYIDPNLPSIKNNTLGFERDEEITP